MAIIYNYNSLGEPFIDEVIGELDNQNRSISPKKLIPIGNKYGIEVVDYDTFISELPDSWKKGIIPPRVTSIFGLLNPVTGKPRIVISNMLVDLIPYDIKYIKLVLQHELVHSGQFGKFKPGYEYTPVTNVYDKLKYYSDPQEIMAWSRTIVDKFLESHTPKSFSDAMISISNSYMFKDFKYVLRNDPIIWKKYLRNVYNYLKMEFPENIDKIIKEEILAYTKLL